jgi:hypothetical protein
MHTRNHASKHFGVMRLSVGIDAERGLQLQLGPPARTLPAPSSNAAPTTVKAMMSFMIAQLNGL